MECLHHDIVPSAMSSILKMFDLLMLWIFRANFVFALDLDLLAVLQQKLAQMLSKLVKMAEEFNVAVFMTNHGQLYFYTAEFCTWMKSLFIVSDNKEVAVNFS